MARPELPRGYLGPQSKWQEWGLATVSHHSPEIHTDCNCLDIKIKTANPMKVTGNLIACGTEQEHKELVFTQTQGDVVSLVVAMPAAGYFKLQIYALLSSDQGKTLPNVYNYLICNTSAPAAPVAPFPKQYAQWKEGCYLCQPLHLDGGLESADFKVYVPGAKAVALTVGSEWFHLQLGSDGNWQGSVNGLAGLRTKAPKASLNANYGPEENKYTSLLEYTL